MLQNFKETTMKALLILSAVAASSVAATLAGSASGYLNQALGYEAFFVFAFVCALPGVFLARMVPREAY